MKTLFSVSVVVLSLFTLGISLSGQQRATAETSLLERSGNTTKLRVSTLVRQITIEIKRGPRTPVELRRADPLTPPFEFDIRILNEDGFPIFTQFGGHAPIDPSWVLETQDAFLAFGYRPNAAAAAESFIVAAEGIGRLRRSILDPSLGPEVDALKRLIPGLMNLANPVSGADSSAMYRNKIAIHDAAISYTFGWGRHGATLLTNITSSGTVVSGWAACNHGRCPFEMPLKCSWTSGLDRPLITSAPMCQTPYDAFSRSGKHNSNDDAKIQYDGVRGGYSPDPSAAETCFDAASHNKPDKCY
jgi:hypothetical protein